MFLLYLLGSKKLLSCMYSVKFISLLYESKLVQSCLIEYQATFFTSESFRLDSFF